jgi:hypothetical protein
MVEEQGLTQDMAEVSLPTDEAGVGRPSHLM